MTDVLGWFDVAVVALFGLLFGSFVNVLIHRLPGHEPIGTERSHCPQCGGAIPWYLNVPLVSYAALGGRCRACRARISLRYPVVEAVSAVVLGASYLAAGRQPIPSLLAAIGIAIAVLALLLVTMRAVPLGDDLSLERLFRVPARFIPRELQEIEVFLVVGALVTGGAVVAALHFGGDRLGHAGAAFLLFGPFALVMVALFAIDLEHQILPDSLTVTGTIVGLMVAPWNPRFSFATTLGDVLLQSLAGAVFGYGLLKVLAVAYRRARGLSGLGGGDLKLAAMIGAFSGPRGVLATLVMASLVGVVFGLTLVVLSRAGMQTPLPFGCFLAPAAFFVVVVGYEHLWDLWQSFLIHEVFDLGVG